MWGLTVRATLSQHKIRDTSIAGRCQGATLGVSAGDDPLFPGQRVGVEREAREAALTVVEARASLTAGATPCGTDGISQ